MISIISSVWLDDSVKFIIAINFYSSSEVLKIINFHGDDEVLLILWFSIFVAFYFILF